MLRKLHANEVKFSLEIQQEDIPFEGNVMVSGDAAYDKEAEDYVRTQLNEGNTAAWCYVKVTAEWQGFRGTAGLGGCSYKSEQELKDDLEPQLQAEALDDLNESLNKIYDKLAVLVKDTIPA